MVKKHTPDNHETMTTGWMTTKTPLPSVLRSQPSNPDQTGRERWAGSGPTKAPGPFRSDGCDETLPPRIGLGGTTRFFIFLFFIFIFYKNIFPIWKFTGYTPAARLPGGRDLAARQRGGRGFCEKNFAEKITRRSLGAGRTAAG